MCKPKNLGLLALNKRSGRLSLKACVPKTWAIIVLLWLDFLSAYLYGAVAQAIDTNGLVDDLAADLRHHGVHSL